VNERGDTAGHADPVDALNQGIELYKWNDVAGAKAAFQEAIASGHADAAPKAARELGLLLWNQGDTARAKAAFQQAIASGHSHAAPLGAFNLGTLLKHVT
jgi:TolA-binding protein